ncbi:MAG TPA: beta-L-arabinofuranosidase domain-containing protein [Bryobacteraceae bacterium]|nr:beta-L-arabinofuranosidase domain-containing protein [Bryobacteraceae bacterium]
MNAETSRRDFFRTAAAGALSAQASRAEVPPRAVLEPFDYRGVRLGKSRWLDQYQSARDYYLEVSNDDILHGWRAAAGLPAPGKPLGGWCARNSDTVFGQWLSGMSRMYCATGDTAMRDKAAYLLAEWAKTIKPDGNCNMGLYAYDKTVCGLVDMERYAGHKEVVQILARTLDWTMRNYSKERTAAREPLLNGRPGEWYTFAENLYRAYQLTGDAKIRDFADTYLYHSFWNEFADTAAPPDAYGVHAYSHVNTFSSAAMAYAVSGDSKYLNVIRNAYDYLQNTQCYATGGYGAMERFVRADGTLGRTLEVGNASFETVCGSWAGFKMSRYLMEFTGEARYGDWTERLLYNGVGAALPITTGGKHFYYSDYRVGGGMKVYKVSRYSCCSGSYMQCVADYHNLIYYKSASSLYVNLYVPSEVTWNDVTLTQETTYPDTDTTTLRLSMKQDTRFPLKFRVPAWTRNGSVKLNGASFNTDAKPGTWAEIERTWKSGDQVDIRIPLPLSMQPVDKQHPRRVAVVRGPVVLVLDDWVFEAKPRLPEPADVDKWLVADDTAGVFRLVPPDGTRVQAKFRPFYAVGEVTPYRMYHDLDSLPIPIW